MGVRLTVRPRESRAEAPHELAGEGFAATYEFDQDRVLVGRGAGADVSLPHRSVSVRHATIEHRNGRYQLVDHGSTNGTRVGGQRLVPERPKPLRDGDVIELGAFVLDWKEAVPITAATTAERTSSLARRLLRSVLAESTGSRARLLVLDGPSVGRELELPPPPARLVVGRGETCDLRIDDSEASREHVEILVDLDGALARDLGSKNGFLVAGVPLTEKRLRDRDELTVGATTIVFEDPTEAALAIAESAGDESMPEPEPLPERPAAAPAPSAEPATAETPGTPTGLHEEAPEPAPRAPRRAFGAAELFVYALAAAVLLVSVAGLVMLLGAE